MPAARLLIKNMIIAIEIMSADFKFKKMVRWLQRRVNQVVQIT